MKEIVYGNRDPRSDDYKILPCLYLNKETDTLFIKGSKGWLKVPTEYSIFHDQPERSKREDSFLRKPLDEEMVPLTEEQFFEGLLGKRCGALNSRETD